MYFHNSAKYSRLTAPSGQKQGLPPLVSDTEQSGSESSVVEIIPGARPQADSDEESINSDNFVVDDENEAKVALPIQFSSHRSQSLKTSFQVVFQLMVHIACLEPHLRKDGMTRSLKGERVYFSSVSDSDMFVGDGEDAEYFRNARDQLSKKLLGVRDSQVASSVWKPEYRKNLETYPELGVTYCQTEANCAACRKSNAISTREATLSGVPYNPLGFQVQCFRIFEMTRKILTALKPLVDDSSSESDSSHSDSDSETQSKHPSQRSLSRSTKLRKKVGFCTLHGLKPTEKYKFVVDDSDDSTIEDDGNSTEDVDNNDEDETDGELPKPFKLGQHCARRTTLHHQITHWEWTLFQIIDKKIDRLKKSKKKKWIQEGDISRPTSTSDPDKIVEWLEKKGIVREVSLSATI